jgi:hypothetical protein
LKVAILSCGALAREVRHICETGGWQEELFFVPPLLHLHPARLRAALAERLSDLQTRYDRTLVVYGQCMPDIDAFLAGFNAHRVQGEHCLEMVGGERFWSALEECSGTYFLIPSWTVSFDTAITEGLGLDKEPRMKEVVFRHYRQVVYFDTLLYGDIDDRVREISAFLDLPLRIERVGVETLRDRLGAALARS